MKRILLSLIFTVFLFAATSCTSVDDSTYGSYDDVVAQYSDYLAAKSNGGELILPDTSEMDERSACIANAIFNVADSWDPESVEKLGYGFKDIDGNGTDELVFLSNYYLVKAIFTYSDGLPILLDACGGGNSMVFATKQRLFMRRNDLVDDTKVLTYYTCRVDGDKMIYDSVYGEVIRTESNEVLEWFEVIDGERVPIDEEAFGALYGERYKHDYEPIQPYYCKREAPRIHYPLNDTDDGAKGLPIADFSSYDAIIKTYETISAPIDRFIISDWLAGKYDGLFEFTSDVDYEYYVKLMLSAHLLANNLGYTEFDLNKDGTNELIILNDDYNIKAIFTIKDGSPILVDAYNNEICWLDEDGLIHVDRVDNDELEFSICELTKDGDYRIVYSILVTANGRQYLYKDFKAEPISFEECTKIYSEYRPYTDEIQPTEYTRNAFELTFTPISSQNDELNSATDKTWHKYVDLERATGKDLACSNTLVSFEKINGEQMTMNVNYAFEFYYPDRDGYLLSDTTESFLTATVNKTDGEWRFECQGIKGRLEFCKDHLWMIIDESTDERFPVGYHCYDVKDDTAY